MRLRQAVRFIRSGREDFACFPFTWPARRNRDGYASTKYVRTGGVFRLAKTAARPKAHFRRLFLSPYNHVGPRRRAKRRQWRQNNGKNDNGIYARARKKPNPKRTRRGTANELSGAGPSPATKKKKRTRLTRRSIVRRPFRRLRDGPRTLRVPAVTVWINDGRQWSSF